VAAVCAVRFVHRGFFTASLVFTTGCLLILRLSSPSSLLHACGRSICCLFSQRVSCQVVCCSPFLLMNDEMRLVSNFPIATALKILLVLCFGSKMMYCF
jgi:hypothetical protein